jgi:hypothetical protein
VSDGAERTVTALLELSLPPVDGDVTGDCLWTLTGVPGSYTLTIIPNGGDKKMGDYNDSDNRAPWYNHRDGIKRAVIKDGVTHIGNWAFSDCRGLTSVTLPNSVTTIGEDAFVYTGLTSVTIPNSVTAIGGAAFAYTGLTSVTLPNSVITIGEVAFYGCTDLTFVTIGNSVTTIGNWAFFGCEKLTSVTIGNSVTAIGNSAFGWCSRLTSVILPNSVTAIGEEAFQGCEKLTSVTIGNSVTTIGKNAFNGCSNLTSVTIPNSVKTIGGWAFDGCADLTSVTIGNSVETIGGAAFAGCTGLTGITSLNATPPALVGDVFDDKSNVALSVPARAVKDYQAVGGWQGFARYIPVYAPGEALVINFTPPEPFEAGEQKVVEYTTGYYVHSITAVNVPAGWTVTPEVSESKITVTAPGDDDSPYTASGAVTLRVSDGDGRTVAVPLMLNFYTAAEGTTGNCLWALTGVPGNYTLTITPTGDDNRMEDNAYDGGVPWVRYMSNIKRVVIKGGVTHIGTYAFEYCDNLTSVTIPNSVKTIGKEAFYMCRKLTSVILPNSVTEIGEFAFGWCVNLTSVTIGNSVTTIGGSAFDGCTNLTTVTNQCTTPQSIYNGTFSTETLGGTLKVPASAVDAYKNTNVWKGFSNIVSIE